MNPAISQAIAFTEVYKKYKDAPAPIREAMCLKAQYPALLPDIKDDDLYACRPAAKRMVYVGSFWWCGLPSFTPANNFLGKQGGYCFDFSAKHAKKLNDEEREAVQALDDFWRHEANITAVYAQTDIRESVGFLVAHDLDKLVKKGLPGLLQDIQAMPESDFKTGMLMMMETIVDVCRYYQKQATDKGCTAIANNLDAIVARAPETLVEALQLIWLVETLSHESHYENNRFDVALGDIYAQNIDSGLLTEEEAIEQIRAFYQIVRECGAVAVCRLMMGGKGRRNEKNADRFIKAALIAEQRHKDVIPQVSLRFYEGMDPALLSLAYDTINITNTFPTLYNDDVNIPGAAKALGVSEAVATEYYPLGCGEYMIGQSSPSILCMSWNVPATINEAIRAANAETFDALYEQVYAAIAAEAKRKADYHRLLVDTHNTRNAFLIASLLTNDCVARGKPILDGGARYLGACVMGHGFTNAGDALMAIKKLVYDEKQFTLSQIIAALDANFEGYEAIRKAMLGVPKFGNDDDEADAMVRRVWQDISTEMKKSGEAQRLDFHIISSVNPGGYMLGERTGATADGRLANMPFAIGNAPTAGLDTCGLTAMMNSITKIDPANGGATTNIKISREFFTKEREKFEALFAAYWASGGMQANVTIVNRDDLEAALKEPEKYPHLLVRLGGWTARFIDLERHMQEEIIRRTLY